MNTAKRNSKQYGVYWIRDGILISDRDENGKDFTAEWEAYIWACEYVSVPEDGLDNQWYIDNLERNQ